jgi:thioredoxin-related protein
MKKLFAILLVLAMMITVVACTGNNDKNNDVNNDNTNDSTNDSTKNV